MEQTIVLKNSSGLHARPAGIFVKKAQAYTSKVEVLAKGKSVNGKSLLSLLTLNLNKGDELILRTEGSDQDQALKDLATFLEAETHLA